MNCDAHAPDDGVARRLAELEAELRQQAEQLARAEADLIDFASVVAHDLRSPLLTISGYSDLLLHEYRGQMGKSGDHYLRSIVDGVGRMNRLLQGLASYAQLRCIGRATGTVSLDAVLADVLGNLDTEIRESNAEVCVDSLPEVLGTHGELVRLFQNLVDNAIKFRGPESPVVCVSAQSESSGHLIRVTDNGMGIDPEHHEAVFRIMHRLPKSRDLPGSGIGLAICKKIVDCYDGRIWIESEPDHGATFLVWLPAEQQTPI